MVDLMEQAALESTYAKAEQLCFRRSVRDMRVEHDEYGFVDLTATVEGLSDSYAAFVMIDERKQHVVDYACTCPAAASYPGMCKHEIALAIEYVMSLAPAGAKRWNTQTEAASAKGKPTVPVQKRVKTSQQITRVLAGYANRAQEEVRLAGAAASVAQTDEPVDLQCVISSGESAYRYSWSKSGTWSLGLKVVRGKTSYVVRHLDQLVEAWHTGATVSYGKNLAFAHTPDAFTDRANDLLALLSDVLEAQQSLYVAPESR